MKNIGKTVLILYLTILYSSTHSLAFTNYHHNRFKDTIGYINVTANCWSTCCNMLQLWNMSDAPEVRARDKGRLHDLTPLKAIWGFIGTVWYSMLRYVTVDYHCLRQHNAALMWTGNDWDIFSPQRQASVAGLLSNLDQSNLCKCRKCSGRSGEYHWHEFHTSTRQHRNPIKSHQILPYSSNLIFLSATLCCTVTYCNQRKTFYGWRLCTAARISGVGIISCQRHYRVVMGHSAGPKSLMISCNILIVDRAWTLLSKAFKHQTSTLWVLPRWRWVK